MKFHSTTNPAFGDAPTIGADRCVYLLTGVSSLAEGLHMQGKADIEVRCQVFREDRMHRKE